MLYLCFHILFWPLHITINLKFYFVWSGLASFITAANTVNIAILKSPKIKPVLSWEPYIEPGISYVFSIFSTPRKDNLWYCTEVVLSTKFDGYQRLAGPNTIIVLYKQNTWILNLVYTWNEAMVASAPFFHQDNVPEGIRFAKTFF